MKKYFLLSAMLIMLSSFSFGQGSEGIKFETGSLKATLAKAKAENKLVFVDVYATWCGPCKRMASEVFTQKKVGDYFNQTFINAKIDAEKGEGIEVAKKYGVKAYPTFLLLNGDGVKVGEMIGGSPADDFIKEFQKLKSNVK